MSLQDFMMRKLIQSKMKDVPADQQEKIVELIQRNPELFQKIAMEVQSSMGGGKDQMSAVKDVLEKYKGTIANTYASGTPEAKDELMKLKD